MEEAIVARELPFPGAYGLDVSGSQRLWSFFHEALLRHAGERRAWPLALSQAGVRDHPAQLDADGSGRCEEFSLAVSALFGDAGEVAQFSRVLPTTRVRKAARMLRERYESAPGETVNVAEVASDVGMNYHWLVHSFADEFGIPPYQYVQALRLAKTRALLLEGPREGLHCLADIATAVGFCDKSHLHRTMKRQYGVSPWQLAMELNPRWGRGVKSG